MDLAMLSLSYDRRRAEATPDLLRKSEPRSYGTANVCAPCSDFRPYLVANDAGLRQALFPGAWHVRRIGEAPMQALRLTWEYRAALRARLVADRDDVRVQPAGFEKIENTFGSFRGYINADLAHGCHRKWI